jgi:hypothetical protein
MPTHYYDPKDIGPGDYVVVLCTKTPDDSCYFDIPGEEEGVWVAKVTKVVHDNETCLLDGVFLWNPERDLTKPLQRRPFVEFIDFEKEALVGVYADEPDFKFTKANVKTLKKFIASLG